MTQIGTDITISDLLICSTDIARQVPAPVDYSQATFDLQFAIWPVFGPMALEIFAWAQNNMEITVKA